VVLGHPEAVIAQLLGAAGKFGGVAQSVARSRTRGNRGKVKNRQGNIDHKIFQPPPAAVSSDIGYSEITYSNIARSHPAYPDLTYSSAVDPKRR
jgi:hypothetical protein